MLLLLFPMSMHAAYVLRISKLALRNKLKG